MTMPSNFNWDDYRAGRYGNPMTIAQNFQQSATPTSGQPGGLSDLLRANMGQPYRNSQVGLAPGVPYPNGTFPLNSGMGIQASEWNNRFYQPPRSNRNSINAAVRGSAPQNRPDTPGTPNASNGAVFPSGILPLGAGMNTAASEWNSRFYDQPSHQNAPNAENRPSAPRSPAPVAPYSAPTAPSVPQSTQRTGLDSSIRALSRTIRLPGADRIDLPDVPGDVSGPNFDFSRIRRIGAASDLPDAPSRAGIDDAIARLRSGNGGLNLPDQVTLGGSEPQNELERLALTLLQSGADPGQMRGERDVPDQVYTDADINQLAMQRSEPGVAAAQQLISAAAESSAGGGSADPNVVRAARARAAIEAAGAKQSALRDTQLEAKTANAQQALAAAASRREDFNADINARLGLGRMKLDTAGTAGSLGQQRRASDQARDIAGYEGAITQRAGDIDAQLGLRRLQQEADSAALSGELGAREQDINYAGERGRQRLTGRGQDVTQREQDVSRQTANNQLLSTSRGQDVTQRGQTIDARVAQMQAQLTQRGQDLEQQYRAAGLNAEQARARAQAEIAAEQARIDQQLGLGRLANERYSTDVNATLNAREQDINQSLGIGRLDTENYQTAANLYNAAQDRSTRIYEIDRRLEDSQLDRSSRDALERERMQLQRELAQAENQIRESQFGRDLDYRYAALDQGGSQFDRQLGEQARQFDTRLDFETEQQLRERNLRRELSGQYADWNAPAPSQPTLFDSPFLNSGRQFNPLSGGVGDVPRNIDIDALLEAATPTATRRIGAIRMDALEQLIQILSGPTDQTSALDRLQKMQRDREQAADERRRLQQSRLWGDDVTGLSTGGALEAAGKIDFLTRQRLAGQAASRRRNALRSAGVNPNEDDRLRVSTDNKTEQEYVDDVRNAADNRDRINRRKLERNRQPPPAYGGGYTSGMIDGQYRGVVTTPGKGSRTFEGATEDAVRQQMQQALAMETDPTRRLALEIALGNR